MKTGTERTHISNKAGIICMLQFFFGATMACFFPFVVVFMLDRNADNSTIGLVLTITAVVTIFSQILWGIISDKIGSIKKVFVTCLVISIAGMLLLTQCREIVSLAIVIVFVTFFASPLSPLLDSWTVQHVRNISKLSYGSVRLWNSIGYAVCVFLMGKLEAIASINIIMVIYCATALITAIAALYLHKPVSGADVHSLARLANIRDVNILFRNFQYVTILIIGVLVYVSITPIQSYLPLLMSHVGGNNELYGLACAVSAISEVPLFYFSNRLLQKFSPRKLLCAAIMFYAIRLMLLSLATTPAIIIIVQILQALTYGLFLVGSIYYIDSLAPSTHKATALSLSTAVYSGTGAILGNFFTVRLIDKMGIPQTFGAGAVLCAATLVLFIVLLSVKKKSRTDKPFR